MPEEYVMIVVVKPWSSARRLASSAIGRTCPIPGLVSMTTCGALVADIILLARLRTSVGLWRYS
jgi:hypothetical protein